MNDKTNIDLEELHSIIKTLEKFIDEYEETLRTLKSILDETKDSWNGDDFKSFKAKYDAITSSDSEAFKAKEQLDNFYDYLVRVENLYNEMKTSAISISREMRY